MPPPASRQQVGLYARQPDKVTTTRSGRQSRAAPQLTQDVRPDELDDLEPDDPERYGDYEDYDEGYDDPVDYGEDEGEYDNLLPYDFEGYTVTAYGEYDPHGVDARGYTRAQNEAWEASQHSRTFMYDQDGYDCNGRDPEGFTRIENREARQVRAPVGARSLSQQTRSPPTPILPREYAHPAKRDSVAPQLERSRNCSFATPQRVPVPTRSPDRPPTTVISSPHVAARENENQARFSRTRLEHPNVENSVRGRPLHRQPVESDDAYTKELRENNLRYRLKLSNDFNKKMDEAERLEASAQNPRDQKRPVQKRLAEWASADPTGCTQRLLEKHYRPHRDNDVVSISSDGSEGRTKLRILPPVPAKISTYLNRYTQAPQQKAMHAKANAPFMEIASIVRSETGMRYGLHAQHDEAVRFMLTPETYTAGVPALKERCLALVNVDPVLFTRVRNHVERMVLK